MAKFRDHHTGATVAEALAQRPGVYIVRHEDGSPGSKPIDTGMPASPAAEAVAKDRYLAWAMLGLRHRDKLVVTLDA